MWIDIKYIIEHQDLIHLIIDSIDSAPDDISRVHNTVFYHKKRWLHSQLNNKIISPIEALTSPDDQIRSAAKQILESENLFIIKYE